MATTPYVDSTLSVYNFGTGNGATGVNGYDTINQELGAGLGTATSKLNDSLSTADFSNPATMLQIQQQMAIYTTGLGVVSATTKSFEDALKGITQKM